jgi:hypothetical protein
MPEMDKLSQRVGNFAAVEGWQGLKADLLQNKAARNHLDSGRLG